MRAPACLTRLPEKTSVDPGPFGYAIFHHSPNPEPSRER